MCGEYVDMQLESPAAASCSSQDMDKRIHHDARCLILLQVSHTSLLPKKKHIARHAHVAWILLVMNSTRRYNAESALYRAS